MPGVSAKVLVGEFKADLSSGAPFKRFERKSDEIKSETRYFITSLHREARSAARLAQAIRGHWSVENKNHWKRDTSLWKEDASRPRKKASGDQGSIPSVASASSCSNSKFKHFGKEFWQTV